MTKVLTKILLLALVASLLLAAPPTPKLVLVVVVDQFRYDYLVRFRGEMHGGLDRLLKQGASFTDAQHRYFPTITACGHALLLSGAMPSVSGIVGNDWFDRQTREHVTSVSDASTKTVGGTGDAGMSPRRLLVATVGDEMKKADRRSLVLGISTKDRSAILLAGHDADGAYWFDEKSGNIVTSTYYRAELPKWVQDYNQLRSPDQFSGAVWLGHKLPAAGPPLYKAIERTPFANQFTEDMAERAIVAEKLGQRDVTDLLAISFSATDYVGHDHGPDSAEIHETVVQTDRVLGRLLEFVDRQVGLGSVLVVMTSDHGVAPVARVDAEGKTIGGRIDRPVVPQALQAALARRYGPGDWVAGCWDELVYLNEVLIAEKKLDRAEVNRTAAQAVLAIPHMARAYTREQLLDEHTAWDETGLRMRRGFHPVRGADIEILPEPYWVVAPADTPAMHGSTYDYDSHVPLIFMGAGIRAASYNSAVELTGVAPTLARILHVHTPDGSVGRVLAELFAP